MVLFYSISVINVKRITKSRSHEVTSNSMLKPKVTILGNFLSDTVKLCVIPSLPNTIKLPATKVHAHACNQYIFRSHNTSTFDSVAFRLKSFHMLMQRRRRRKGGKKLKELRLYICIVFKRCHSSERVNYRPDHA